MPNAECRMTKEESVAERGRAVVLQSAYVIRHSSFPIHSSRSGYILLELVIALTIFAIAVLGLTNSLNTALGVQNTLNRESAMRMGLRSFLEEARKKKTTGEMAMTQQDDRLGVTYSSTLEDAGLQNKSGKTLADLYKLTAKATIPNVAEDQQPEPVTVYVYQPQKSSR